MEYGKIIENSYYYAIEAVWGKWERWLLLLMSVVVFPLMLGYIAKIYRGDSPPPRFEEGGLFLTGLKLFFAALIYAIPIIVVLILTFMFAFISFMPYLLADKPGYIIQHLDQFVGALAGIAGGLVIALVLAIIIAFIETIGLIRLAKTGKFSEAFNFGEIMKTIRGIGWGYYIVAMIILWLISIVFYVILMLIQLIPVIGVFLYFVIYLVTIVPFIIFASKYLTLVYESAAPPVPLVQENIAADTDRPE